ncbi:MAG TPA: DUF5522 domain-containing protein [Holophagaceae bacterium]|jgi:hypothetical protein|nr:DUF5522 domain-containing protein [Holophagaceae bacterium]
MPEGGAEVLGYWDGPYWVFTEAHHLRRGTCCGNRCRHCPFEPKALKGCAKVRADVTERTSA